MVLSFCRTIRKSIDEIPLSWYNDVNFNERGVFYARTSEKDAM